MNNENISLKEQLNIFDEQLDRFEADKDYCMEVYQHMQELADECFRSGEYDKLFELSPYFESPKSYPKFHMTGETYRINILLNIIRIEHSYPGSVPFLSDVDSFESYVEKYTLTIFALRRLELALAEQSMQEARAYLENIHLSPYVAAIIVENERFEKCPRLYWNLYECMADIWTAEEKIFWLKLFDGEYDGEHKGHE
jgi:proteasome lid subunit RPN8/RPN11